MIFLMPKLAEYCCNKYQTDHELEEDCISDQCGAFEQNERPQIAPQERSLQNCPF